MTWRPQRIGAGANRVLPILVIGVVLLMIASLIWGFFDVFTFATDKSSEKGSLQGTDFFGIPKAYRNLLENRSMYDTWGGRPWGPYAAWFISHPAFGVFFGSYFAFFDPWTSYWIFTFLTLGILGYCAHLVGSFTDDVFEQHMMYVLFFCSLLTYWLLYGGNTHSITVLSLTLLLCGMYRFAYAPNDAGAATYVTAGVLLSLFSKPVALLAFPALLINNKTRRLALKCLALYVVVSLLFLVVPALNPESIGLEKTIAIALDPDFILKNMNIYANRYVLNPYMKDNSIHWFHMFIQSAFEWNHIEVFSFPVFVTTVLGVAPPGAVYKLPLIFMVLSSVGLLFVKDEQERLQASVLVVLASTFAYFLGYNTVWQYQYTSLFPSIAIVFLMYRRRTLDRRIALPLLLLGVFYYLPTPYVLLRDAPVTNANMAWMKSTRIVPTVISFLLLAVAVLIRLSRSAVKHVRSCGTKAAAG